MLRKSVWAVRDVRLVVPGRALAMGANALLLVVLQLRVHDAGGGPVWTAALLAAMAAPSVLGMDLAGRVADRTSSRRVLVAAYAVAAVATGLVAVAPNLPTTLAAALLLETVWTFANPVWSALVPRIVGEERVSEAMGLQMAASGVLAPLGAGVGGALVAACGDRWALAAPAAVFALLVPVAAAVRTVRSPEAAPDGAGRPAGGLSVLRGDAVVWPVLCGLTVFVVAVAGVNVVEVYLVRDALRGTATDYGIGQVVFGAGAVGGSLLVGRARGAETCLRWCLAALVGCAVGIAGLGAAPSVPVFWAVSVAVGLLNSLATGCLAALVAVRTPDDRRGRAFAALNGLFNGANVLAIAAGGVLGVVLGPRGTFVLAGLVSALLATAVAWLVRRSWWPAGHAAPAT